MLINRIEAKPDCLRKGGEFMLKLLLILMSLALMMLPGVALASTGNNFVVPEPTTILLLVSGLLGLWGFRKKFKK